MKQKKIVFRLLYGVIAVALVLATLQIIFDVPILRFFNKTVELAECCQPGSTPRLELTASYDNGVQRATGDVTPSAYPSLTVQRGIPVELTLTAESNNINDINEYISLPDFGIKDMHIIPGENIVRFTPQESGVFFIDSRSGNLKSIITVIESLGFPSQSAPADTAEIMRPSPDASFAPRYEKPKTSNSLGGWLEEQVIPSSGAEGVHESKTWTGWIIDRDCVGIDPAKHTKACNLMGSCYDSGLGICEYIPGKEFDIYSAADTFLVLDGASKELATAFLKALPEDWRNNVTVKVTGYAVNNIPASSDELLIPETDNSRVDHYLNGIHILSIEAAYIDGVSTYPLPSPNVVLMQP